MFTSRLPIAPLSALAVFMGSAIVVWMAYVDAGEVVGSREPPLVKAATTPLKRSPDDPGGREVADLGGVGDLLSERQAAAEERLLPRPERPVTPGEVGTGLSPNERLNAATALEALVSEIRSEDESGAGGPNPDDDVTFPAPSKPETPAAAATTRERQAVRVGALDTAPGGEPVFQADAAGRYRVQLAAVREEADAERAWAIFQEQLGPFISGLRPFFERAETDNGVFYRVQVGPFGETAEADRLCVELKKQNASCFVVTR